MSERDVAQAVASLAGLTVAEVPIGFALSRGPRVVMQVFCVLMPKLELPSVPLCIVQHLRDSAAAGLEARVVFASPEGVFVKKVGPGSIDGWIGLERGQMRVYFGSVTVGGKVFNEEAEPLRQVAPSKKEWFA